MTSNNSTVFFDLGNVLVFFSHEKMFSQLAKCTGIEAEELKRKTLEHNLNKLYETGKMTTQALYEALQSISSESFSMADMKRAMSEIFTPNYALWPLVEQLKNQGTKLVLLSNTNECHFEYIRNHYSVLNHFDAFILSHKVGACKPDPLIFQRALELSSGRAFYTDDIPLFVEAGRSLGLDAEVFIDHLSLKTHLKNRSILA